MLSKASLKVFSVHLVSLMIDSWPVLAVSLKKETQSLVLTVVLSLRPLFRMTEVVNVKKNKREKSYNFPTCISGAGPLSSKHHSVLRGFFWISGVLNFRLQVSLGTTVHSCFGSRLGTNLVTRRQVFWGFKSQTSSGTSTKESIFIHILR